MIHRPRVDMHTHTEHSPDSRTSLRGFAQGVAKAGLDVVCVTDHNTVDGALRLREMDVPFRIVVGEEILTRDGEIIGLFLERAVPRGLTAEDTIGRIHEQGGLAYVPHPFSRNRRSHIRRAAFERVVRQVDAIEVFNAREVLPGDNRRAYGFASAYGVAHGAGSDAHRPGELGRAYVEVPDFATAQEFLAALRAGRVAGRLSGLGVHVATRYDTFRKWLACARRRAR